MNEEILHPFTHPMRSNSRASNSTLVTAEWLSGTCTFFFFLGRVRLKDLIGHRSHKSEDHQTNYEGETSSSLSEQEA